jgi:hypothetical protein
MDETQTQDMTLNDFGGEATTTPESSTEQTTTSEVQQTTEEAQPNEQTQQQDDTSERPQSKRGAPARIHQLLNQREEAVTEAEQLRAENAQYRQFMQNLPQMTQPQQASVEQALQNGDIQLDPNREYDAEELRGILTKAAAQQAEAKVNPLQKQLSQMQQQMWQQSKQSEAKDALVKYDVLNQNNDSFDKDLYNDVIAFADTTLATRPDLNAGKVIDSFMSVIERQRTQAQTTTNHQLAEKKAATTTPVSTVAPSGNELEDLGNKLADFKF